MKRDMDEPAMREAADWILASRDRPLTRRERRQLADWLRDSPANVREYLEASTVWNDMAHVDQDGAIDVAALSQADNVVPFPAMERIPKSSNSPRRRRGRLFAVAATSFAIVAATVLYLQMGGDVARRVVTGLGEQMSVTLADGSIIHLNTLSDVRVDFGRRRRGVDLVAGEALFTVARDPDRPFTVRTGSAEVEAIGTRFNLRRREGVEVVTVVEGAVKVRPIHGNVPTNTASPDRGMGDRTAFEPFEVVGGHQVELHHSGGTGPLTEVSVDRVIAWTDRRLVFDGDTLSTIADEFNRYNATKLRVLHSRIGGLRLSGIFAANDPQSLAEYLRTLDGHPIHVEYTDGTIDLSLRDGD